MLANHNYLWKGFLWGLILTVFTVSGGAVRANNVNPVTIQIADVLRYRIDDSKVVSSDAKYVIEAINVAVLSNSDHLWQLAVLQKNNSSRIDWSFNGRIWYQFNTESTIILTGSRSFWNNYCLYYRYQAYQWPAGVNFQYQIQFQDE